MRRRSTTTMKSMSITNMDMVDMVDNMRSTTTIMSMGGGIGRFEG